MTAPCSAVHQFHSGTAVGDAITQQMFFLRDRLRGLGLASNIYAEHIPPELADEVADIRTYAPSQGDLLFVHHSMGHTAFDHLMSKRVPMVTVFHSITPPGFFTDASLRSFIRLGFDQLRVLARRSLLGIADSNHNRREMYDAGFSTVSVLPVRTEYSAARAAGADRSAWSPDWLFVGRVVPNKCQFELVQAFAAYRAAFQPSANLTMIGDVSLHSYVDDVRIEIARLELDDAVRIPGKVSESELWSAYGSAGLFVCMSEHEGFGVPLLEAMAAGLPVVARAEAAVPETMGGAGALVRGFDPYGVAAVCQLISTDASLRERMVLGEDRRLARIEEFDVDGLLADVLARAAGQQHPATVQVQGPFETSYSLAVLNREVALALDRRDEFEVSIHATEGPGDYEPSPADLALVPEAATLHARSRTTIYPDVAIRQMYPPRVDDATGGLTFQYFGWEESLLPDEYVRDFNRHLDGVGAMSSFVCDVLRNSGVTVPLHRVGIGVTAPKAVEPYGLPEIDDLRRHRFLHISSAFPRKGVDVLLAAYFAVFTGDDDVSLVIKTFPNPHNGVAAQLDALRAASANPPDVRWIDRDLEQDQIDALYGRADCLVHPARGEGFGLPVAEAMLAGVPIISVAATGLADFVGDDTAATIGFTIEPAATHLSIPGSTWVEPNRGDLERELLSSYRGDDAARRAVRVQAARTLIQEEFSWDRVADRWAKIIADARSERPGVKVAYVSTFNSRCGIAEYTADLADGLGRSSATELFANLGVEVLDPDLEDGVDRSWIQHFDHPVDELIERLEQSGADIVHIQFNYGFFGMEQLGRLVRSESKRRPVVVTLHRTIDLAIPERVISIRDAIDDLRRAAVVIVHQRADVERLRSFGLVDNVLLVPIGCDPPVGPAVAPRVGEPFVIGTFGFLLPHKGTIDLIRAVPALKRAGLSVRLIAVCALHPDPPSHRYREECEREIHRLGLDDDVDLITDFLPEETARELLGNCDLLVLPYRPTDESSSAALRFLLPLGLPILTSDLPIFEDARDAIATVPSPVTEPEMSAALLRLHADLAERARLGRAARAFTVEHSWGAIGRRMRVLYADLVRAARS